MLTFVMITPFVSPLPEVIPVQPQPFPVATRGAGRPSMCDNCRCTSHACEDSLSKIAQSPAKARDCAKKVRQGRQAPEEASPRSKKALDNRSHLIPLPLQSSQPALSRPHHSTNSIAAATSDRQPPPRSRATATSGSMHRIRHAGHSQPHLRALAHPLRTIAFADRTSEGAKRARQKRALGTIGPAR